MNESITCKSVFISDLHLGTRDAQSEQLLEFIRIMECETLYLVGDIIDGWEIKRNWRWSQAQTDVLQKILRKARKGTKVHYIIGNHDEFLHSFLPIMMGDNITISHEKVHLGVNGKRYLVVHGDMFDAVTMTKKWVAHLGDRAYLFLLSLNRPINKIRRFFGIYNHWSLSKIAKQSVKQAVSFITDYEEVLSGHADDKGFDGVICGHIHQAEIRTINGIDYLNCGDWVESCTAVVEHYDGRFEIYEHHQNH
ncbi:MAG: UDP-2,3-diacylglucosamine diphosphatase [Sulfuricurvum sp.]|nr:UDP-2,3-diacylglucosamine diphosphatase [Sulfuricurvum sp.]